MAEIFFNLPTDKTYYRFTKTLDLVSYQFSFQYLKKIDSWVMDIDSVIVGVNIVGGVDLTKQFKHLSVPQGVLELVDLDELNRDPTQETLGARIVLKYTEVS